MKVPQRMGMTSFGVEVMKAFKSEFRLRALGSIAFFCRASFA